MSVLECSSAGDKRFSALFAYVNVFGVWDSIENHYQNSKKDKFGNKAYRNKDIDHISIFNIDFPIEYLTPFYKMLWCEYLDNHNNLVEYAKQFDDFNDQYRRWYTINCQADVIRQYVKEGRESIINEISPFIKILYGEIKKKLN